MYGAIKSQQILQPLGMLFLDSFFAILIEACRSPSCHVTQSKLTRASRSTDDAETG